MIWLGTDAVRLGEVCQGRTRCDSRYPAWRKSGLLRPSEWLLVIYFLVAGMRAGLQGHYSIAALDGCVPLLFAALEACERSLSRAWTAIARDWVAMPLLLIAYWNVDFVTRSRWNPAFGQRWIGIDRLLLNDWHGRALIESLGSFLPSVLELSYLLLYTMPPILLGLVYLFGGRRRAGPFLVTLLSGTLLTYALLPQFPSQSPRLSFPGQDLPSLMTLFRTVNVWLLDRWDIRASVFPSGHVAVAYSSAFAVMAALPERRWFGRVMLVFACLVAVQTVYGRYHFAVDAAAGFLISLLGHAVGATVSRPFALGGSRPSTFTLRSPNMEPPSGLAGD